MKKNLLALLAVASTVVFSAFTTKIDVLKYLVYVSGTQRDIDSYQTPTTTQPNHVNDGTGKLNWFRVLDQNNDGISDAEFESAFDAYDITPSTNPLFKNGLLSDESDISNELDVKQP